MSKPAEARHWAAMEERGIVWGMRILLWIYRMFGRGAFRLVLYPVVGYYFVRNSAARNASRDYLARIGRYFTDVPLTGSLADSFAHFRVFAETLLDKVVVWIDTLDPAQVEFHNRELLVERIAQNQGVMLLCSHVGNLEICRALAELRDQVALTILVHTKHAAKFNRLLGSVERRGKIELIEVSEIDPAVAIDLLDRLGRGEMVVVVGDRVPVNSIERTVRVPFLGAPADFPQGPYLLAALLRCPVYAMFSYPWEGKFHIFLEPFAERIDVPRRETERTRVLAELAGRFAARLEFHCHRVPLQWFNFFPFWASAVARRP